MEHTHENEYPAKEAPTVEEGYAPRPTWQVWAARAALVIFILLVINQILSIARGGL